MELTIETRNNSQNEVRVVESRRANRKSALRSFDLAGRNLPGEFESWVSRFDGRVDFLRRKFAHVLRPKEVPRGDGARGVAARAR